MTHNVLHKYTITTTITNSNNNNSSAHCKMKTSFKDL